jgi:lysophospholipase L1-like esterase
MHDEPSRRSPVGPLLVRLALVLGAVYGVLVVATRRPGFALGVEVATVATVWLLYAVRFAFDAPGALRPEMFAFELRDRVHPPARDSFVFVGSSTIAHWTSLAEDLAPMPVVRRGISGARLSQLAALMPPLLAGYAPRAVILYAGENDLAGFLGSRARPPEAVLESFEHFCRELHRRLPRVPIYFLSIKPAKARRARAAAFEAANRLIAQACGDDASLHFVDATTPLLAADGSVRADVYEGDGIHLNGEGYRILGDVIRKQLI